jgi:hypothetical protein
MSKQQRWPAMRSQNFAAIYSKSVSAKVMLQRVEAIANPFKRLNL